MNLLATWPSQEFGVFPQGMLLLFGIALIISAIGFYRVVYFISIGYAFSIVAMAIVTPLMLRANLTWATALQNILLAVWGLRLGIFLFRREFRPSYRGVQQATQRNTGDMPLIRKALIWIGVSVLYALMFSPSLFSLAGATATVSPLTLASQLVGCLILAGGLTLEGVADRQKSEFKASSPSQFCNVGLYRWVRSPNYLGEILVWVGSWVMGVTFYAAAWQWMTSLIGLIGIVLIMMGSTKRLEREQHKRYGDLPAFQQYVSSVPVLFPFVPLYTLKNVRVYLE